LNLAKRKVLAFTLVVLSVILIARFSFLRSSFRNVSAIETWGTIGVYSDENAGHRVTSTSWGVLSPGESKELVVYVRNEGNESVVLSIVSKNWNPSDAPKYLSLSWNFNRNRIGVGEVAKITQVLHVSSQIKAITSFSFDLSYEAYVSLALGDFDFILAINSDVRMIYPSASPNKPLNCSPSLVSDWTASSFIFKVE